MPPGMDLGKRHARSQNAVLRHQRRWWPRGPAWREEPAPHSVGRHFRSGGRSLAYPTPGTHGARGGVEGAVGLEPTTYRLKVCCSTS